MAERFCALVVASVLASAGCTHPIEFSRDEPREAPEPVPLARRLDVAISSSEMNARLARAFRRELRGTDDVTVASGTRRALDELALRVKTRATPCWANMPICWPGFVIFAPAWSGLRWHYTATALVAVMRPDGTKVADVWQRDAFTVRYTSNGPGVGAGLGWLPTMLTIPALLTGVLSLVLPAPMALFDEEFALHEGEEWASTLVADVLRAISADAGP
jgi:hypothetical protein